MAETLLQILNAVRNGSTVAADPATILAILAGKPGHPSHLRAVFGDVALDALERAAAAHGIGFDTILDAYARARHTVAAANPALDALLDERARCCSGSRSATLRSSRSDAKRQRPLAANQPIRAGVANRPAGSAILGSSAVSVKPTRAEARRSRASRSRPVSQ